MPERGQDSAAVDNLAGGRIWLVAGVLAAGSRRWLGLACGRTSAVAGPRLCPDLAGRWALLRRDLGSGRASLVSGPRRWLGPVRGRIVSGRTLLAAGPRRWRALLRPDLASCQSPGFAGWLLARPYAPIGCARLLR